MYELQQQHLETGVPGLPDRSHWERTLTLMDLSTQQQADCLLMCVGTCLK
jgi:hypothetical protein